MNSRGWFPLGLTGLISLLSKELSRVFSSTTIGKHQFFGPIYLDSWTWHSRFLCNIALYSMGLYFHHQSHPQLVVVFALASFPFFVELFLHWSAVAYWVPTNLGSSSFSVLSFCLFMGFSRQEYWGSLPFPSPVDHILSELSTMTRPFWMAQMACPTWHGSWCTLHIS